MLQPRDPAATELRGSDVRESLRVVAPGALPVLVVDRPPSGWHTASNRRSGTVLLDRLERAVAAGRDGIAHACRQDLLGMIHADRRAALHDTAMREGLALEPAGNGPVVDREATIRTPLGTWRVRPLGARYPGDLPQGAAQALRAWSFAGELFDGVYVGEEDDGRCVAAVLSPDGVAGEWFLLARWTA